MAQSENLDFQEIFKKIFFFLGRNIENLSSKNDKKISIFFQNLSEKSKNLWDFSNFSKKFKILKSSKKSKYRIVRSIY